VNSVDITVSLGASEAENYSMLKLLQVMQNRGIGLTDCEAGCNPVFFHEDAINLLDERLFDLYYVNDNYDLDDIYYGSDESYLGKMIVAKKDPVNYIKNNCLVFSSLESYKGSAVNVKALTDIDNYSYLVTFSDSAEEPSQSQAAEASKPNEAAQKALQASVKQSSYASATGESMTRIEAAAGSVAIDGAADIVPNGAKFTSSNLTSGATYDFAVGVVAQRIGANTNFAVYEMNLTDQNGTAIHQLDGKVNVTLPIPEGLNAAAGNVLVVYRVNDDGTITRCDTATANGFLTFATDHFSTYAIVEESASGAASAGTQTTSPKTEDNGMTMAFMVIAVMSLASAAVVSKKRFHN
jgi:hypothetical protein